MRIKNSISNMIFGLCNIFVCNILAFLSRSLFIYVLGTKYLGVSGLFTNILMMLSLSELGISSAINYSLYRPISQGNIEKISMLMSFYKKAYRSIGFFVAFIGFVMMFFLKYFIKGGDGIPDLRVIYLLYLFNTVSGYFMSYKNTLVSAYQKDYTLVPINVCMSIVINLVQMLALWIFKNFITYIALQILLNFVQRLVINFVINKRYSYINFNCKNKLPQEELKVITKNVKAMFFHKIGEYCVLGTDNIVISTFIGIGVVGIYSNYNMLITTVNTVIMIVFNSTSASFGELITEASDEKKLHTFQVLNFLGFWIFGFSSICFFNLLSPFISLWLGPAYLVANSVVLPVVINYFISGMRVPLSIVKMSGGVYSQDKFVPLIQSTVNLFFSVLLVRHIGLAGVFWGTVISCIVPFIYRPYVVYKYIFNKSCRLYFQKYIYYTLVFCMNFVGSSFLCRLLFYKNNWTSLLGRGCICFFIPNLIVILLFMNKYEFKQIIEIIINVRGGIGKWRKKLA